MKEVDTPRTRCQTSGYANYRAHHNTARHPGATTSTSESGSESRQGPSGLSLVKLRCGRGSIASVPFLARVSREGQNLAARVAQQTLGRGNQPFTLDPESGVDTGSGPQVSQAASRRPSGSCVFRDPPTVPVAECLPRPSFRCCFATEGSR